MLHDLRDPKKKPSPPKGILHDLPRCLDFHDDVSFPLEWVYAWQCAWRYSVLGESWYVVWEQWFHAKIWEKKVITNMNVLYSRNLNCVKSQRVRNFMFALCYNPRAPRTWTLFMVRGALVKRLDKCLLKDSGPWEASEKTKTCWLVLGKQCLHSLPKRELLKSDEIISFDSFGTMKILEVRRYRKLESD